MDTQPDTIELPSQVLTIRDLTKTYGKVHVLQGLNLNVQEGEVYGFLGRNGAGKSTTIRIVMGITRASSGAVHLFDRPLRSHATALRQQIGYVAQEQNFYGWMTPSTIGDFVGGFYPTWDRDAYAKLIGSLDLPWRRKIRTFSGGMRSKLALALALSHQPRFLVLDEPTAGLDAVARREFIEMVREQAEQSGRTTFFSSHLIDEVEVAADRVGIIEDGRMLYEGSLKVLSESARLLKQKLTDTAESPLPDMLTASPVTILQDRIRHGERQVVVRTSDTSVFNTLSSTHPDWQINRLSLEDIFVEMVSKPLG